jgi:nickel-dependent lactate racemase
LTSIDVEIGWGETTRTIAVPRGSKILNPQDCEGRALTPERVGRALEAPMGSLPLSKLAARSKNVCILLPDESRKAIPDFILSSILRCLVGLDVSVGIASGKHPKAPSLAGQWRHDAFSPDLVFAGTTGNGTKVEFPRVVLDADLRILVGEIRPHYFAGYAGGAKTLFPGVAGQQGIWHNHELKAHESATLGMVNGNRCREDMEAAARLAGPSFMVNIIRNPSGLPVDVVTGDIVEAHRLGVSRARRYFEIYVASRSSVVIVSDKGPVTKNLYQACKLLPVAARLLRDGGTIILCAECGDGLGPIDIINEGIYRLGMLPILPPDHRIVLVSSQDRVCVEKSFAEYAPDVKTAISNVEAKDLVILPYAGELIPLVSDCDEKA